MAVAQGQSVTQVAQQLGVDPSSVRGWLDRYESARDPTALTDLPRDGRERCWEEEDLEVLDGLLACRSPQQLGYPASQWTVPLLQEHLGRCGLPACSPSTLRRYLAELDWVWKRPRYVLAPDPEKEKKTPDPPAAGAHKCPSRRAFRG